MTIALLPGSPAIDKGNPAICNSAPVGSIDQRGFTRVSTPGGADVGTACDIGAFEVANFTPATPPPASSFEGTQVHQSPILNTYPGLNFQPCVQFWDFTRPDTNPLTSQAVGQPGYKISGAKAAAITSPTPNLHCEFSISGLTSRTASGRPGPGGAFIDDLTFDSSNKGDVTITTLDGNNNQIEQIKVPANYNQGSSTTVKFTKPGIVKVTFDAVFSNVQDARCDLSKNELFNYCLVIDNLKVNATPGANFFSNPQPNSVIDLGSAPIGTPLSQSIAIANNGNAPLTVSAADGLSIPFSTSPATAFTLETGKVVGIAVQCTPAALASYSTTLTFNTNDPAQPRVSYTVKCRGTTPPEASSFNMLAPARLYDSRTNAPTSVPLGRDGLTKSGEIRPIQATGTKSGQVPPGATAILANVTIADAVGGGYVTLFPADQSDATTSTVNWYSGGARVVGSFTLVALDANGQFKLKAGGATNVIIDVVGYMSKNSQTASSSAAFAGVFKALPVGINPRLYDSREIGISGGLAGAGTGPLTKGEGPRTLPVSGDKSLQNIPASATAVVVNLTAVNTVGGGYFALYPAGNTAPAVATVNWNNSQTPGTNIPRDVGNLAIVPLSSDGRIAMAAGGNSDSAGANIVIDVLGYIDQPTSGVAGFYYPLATPQRVYDSRPLEPNYANSTKGVLGPKATRLIKTAGLGIPKTARSLIVRITTVDVSGGGYLALYADVFTGAVSVNVNGRNQQVGNVAVVNLDSNGNFTVLNGSLNNSIGFVIDVLGYL